MKKIILLFLIHFLYFDIAKSQSAEEISKSTETSTLSKIANTASEAASEINQTLNETKTLRQKANYYLLANYAPIDLLIPSKYGLTIGAINNVDKSFELELLQSDLSAPGILKDIGKMTDQRFSIIRRTYFGTNSFNMSYGLSYFNFNIKLSDEILSRTPNTPVDTLDIQSLGLNIGIGNRWSFKNKITLSIDWISIAQPLYTLNKNTALLNSISNKDDKDNVEKAIDVISFTPRFSVLKLQAGFIF